jgi:hypothetical protein
MLFIDDLLLLPFSGFSFVMRTIRRIAEEQWTDDAPLKQQLLELQVKLDEQSITEEEYVVAEREILQALRDVQNRRRELAGLPPEPGAGLTGKVKDGAGVSINLSYGEREEK